MYRSRPTLCMSFSQLVARLAPHVDIIPTFDGTTYELVVDNVPTGKTTSIEAFRGFCAGWMGM